MLARPLDLPARFTEESVMRNAFGFFLCAILLGGFGCASTTNTPGASTTSARSTTRISNGGPDFVTLVKRLRPAVVNVSATWFPVTGAPNGIKPQGSFNDGALGNFFG